MNPLAFLCCSFCFPLIACESNKNQEHKSEKGSTSSWRPKKKERNNETKKRKRRRTTIKFGMNEQTLKYAAKLL